MEKQRQAIILIHGIGEQWPMATLRAFVDAVLDQKPTGSDVDAEYYSRPDLLSDTFELRRLVSAGGRSRTDFYEFYWAHLMPVATWGRLRSWYLILMRRPWKDVPQRFTAIWLASWIALAAILVFGAISVVRFAFGQPSGASPLDDAPWLLGALLAAAGFTIRSYVGDAAVYLSPAPPNIEARQTIRAAGLKLLEAVAGSGRYDRIILVGHSLGSVIGHDVLSLAWQRHFETVRAQLSAAWAEGRFPEVKTVHLRAGEALAKRIRGGELAGKAAHDAWRAQTRLIAGEQSANGFHWPVTDFVTLGSPLAHAALLLARNHADFLRRTRERELPLCPPVGEVNGKFSYEHKGRDNLGRPQRALILHSAAPFAETVWTNLYFPSRRLIWGDVIGGPVAPLFLAGVGDVEVKTRAAEGLFSHTRYWHRDSRDTDPTTAPLARLRAALDFGRRSFSPPPQPAPPTASAPDSARRSDAGAADPARGGEGIG